MILPMAPTVDRKCGLSNTTTRSSRCSTEEVREFLFHTWAEVLATASVRHGAQSRQALEFKRAAHDLLWAVSAKPFCIS